MAPPKQELQAFTLRIPKDEYELLRTLGYVMDRSLNEVVLMALRRILDDPTRARLNEVRERAELAFLERDRITDGVLGKVSGKRGAT